MAKDNESDKAQDTQAQRKTDGTPRGAKKRPNAKAASVHQANSVDGSKVIPEMPKGLILAAIGVLVVLVGVIYVMSMGTTGVGATTTTTIAASGNPNVVENNDIVAVDYTGTFENGSVFDSSIKDVAQQGGVYNPLRTYEPLEFTMGYGGLIKGFEGAIMGMKALEEKDIVLQPDQAYGSPRADLVKGIEKYQRSPMVQNVSIERFRTDLEAEPTAGREYYLTNKTSYKLDWPIRVLDVQNDTVVFTYVPNGTATITTVFGPALVYGDGEDIVIEITAREGQKIVTVAGPARVVNVTNDLINLDFNHELAGKTLKFHLKLWNITKQA
jgi:FKBP-type peptidyl-prolyl cis-trans isomerase 2